MTETVERQVRRTGPAWAARLAENEGAVLAFFAGLAGLVAAGALTASTGQDDLAGIARLVDGTAHRPYIYRQLVPLLIRLVQALLPAGAGPALGGSFWARALSALTGQSFTGPAAADLLPVTLGALVNFLSLLGFAYGLRALLRDYAPGPRLWHILAVGAAVYGLVYLNREGVYSYDYPLLALHTAGLICLARRRWAAYYLVFGLSALNKETTLVLLWAWAAVFWERRRTRRYWAHLAVQAAVYGVVTAALRLAWAGAPGSLVEQHLLRNLRLLANPPDDYGRLLLLLAGLALVVWGWRCKPVALRRMLLAGLPLVAFTLAFGWIEELRDYYELYPPLTALIYLTLARGPGGQPAAAEEPL